MRSFRRFQQERQAGGVRNRNLNMHSLGAAARESKSWLYTPLITTIYRP